MNGAWAADNDFFIAFTFQNVFGFLPKNGDALHDALVANLTYFLQEASEVVF